MTEPKKLEEETIEQFLKVPEIEIAETSKPAAVKQKRKYASPKFRCAGNAEFESSEKNHKISGYFEPGDENFKRILEREPELKQIVSPEALEDLRRKFRKPGAFIDFYVENAYNPSNHLKTLTKGRKVYLSNGKGFVVDFDKNKIFLFKSNEGGNELKPKQLEYILNMAHRGIGQINVGFKTIEPTDYSFSNQTSEAPKFAGAAAHEVPRFEINGSYQPPQWHMSH